MSARINYAGGPLSFLLFAVLLFVLTVLGFILDVCEKVWRGFKSFGNAVSALWRRAIATIQGSCD